MTKGPFNVVVLSVDKEGMGAREMFLEPTTEDALARVARALYSETSTLVELRIEAVE